MKTEAELLCEEHGMEYPNTDDIMHVLKGTRNPVPSKAKLGDYFINQWGWQIRMIIRIEGLNCAYECYHL